MNAPLRALLCSLAVFGLAITAPAQDPAPRTIQQDKFRQLEELLPTPNSQRTASGAPGPQYWQQRADYQIDVEIDDQRIIGSERITYYNHSPDTLRYLWVQIDNNIFAPDSDAVLTSTTPGLEKMSLKALRSLMARQSFDGGVRITRVESGKGAPLQHTVVKTMMRVDLPRPLASGESFAFEVDWNYTINRSDRVRGRTGCEYFEKDDNYLYELAHWFPRMAAYTDVAGWHNKQFLGSGEFTLEFGDYLVRITAPADHIVAATGVLQNPEEVLTTAQRERLEQAKTAKRPMFIVTPDEALNNESSRATDKKTWVFDARDVRDFAFASSRKFIWDAQLHNVEDNPVMAMSFYPKEGEPLWSRYSTQAIVHTLDVYSRYTFKYPYPVAISVNGPVGGMEYPMICFNGPRPEEDGTYTPRSKYGLISVVIHEVGHNYFPMIVNSDERQWTWMDEGINTFLQFLAEQEWEDEYPSRRGEPKDIVTYMSSTDQVPIMTNSESLLQFGNNAYAKPATALNVLRETVLGRELFDFAFQEYARRWEFKRPMPADFFRTMEDASGIDLDWFWRGWFYTTDHCDLAVTGVRQFDVESPDPEIEKPLAKAEREREPITLISTRNENLPKRANAFTELKDFYNGYDPLDVTQADLKSYGEFLESLDEEERKLLDLQTHFYLVDLENLGGLVMPVILEMHFTDGTTEELRIPAEIWRRDACSISKLITTDREIERLVLDPHLETADTDLENNHFPRQVIKSRFELFKDKQEPENPMQKAQKEEQPGRGG